MNDILEDLKRLSANIATIGHASDTRLTRLEARVEAIGNGLAALESRRHPPPEHLYKSILDRLDKQWENTNRRIDQLADSTADLLAQRTLPLRTRIDALEAKRDPPTDASHQPILERLDKIQNHLDGHFTHTHYTLDKRLEALEDTPTPDSFPAQWRAILDTPKAVVLLKDELDQLRDAIAHRLDTLETHTGLDPSDEPEPIDTRLDALEDTVTTHHATDLENLDTFKRVTEQWIDEHGNPNHFPLQDRINLHWREIRRLLEHAALTGQPEPTP